MVAERVRVNFSRSCLRWSTSSILSRAPVRGALDSEMLVWASWIISSHFLHKRLVIASWMSAGTTISWSISPDFAAISPVGFGTVRVSSSCWRVLIIPGKFLQSCLNCLKVGTSLIRWVVDRSRGSLRESTSRTCTSISLSAHSSPSSITIYIQASASSLNTTAQTTR